MSSGPAWRRPLPSCHAQLMRKSFGRTVLRNDIGIDEAVSEEVRQDAAAADKVVAHAVMAVEILQGDSRTALPWPPAFPCQRWAAFVHRRIDTDVGDDGKILVSAHPLQKRPLCVPAVERENGLALVQFRHDNIHEVCCKLQLALIAILPPHLIPDGHRDIMDVRDAASDEDRRDADGEAHETVAVHIRMTRVIRMVEENGCIFEFLPEFSDRRVIYAQEDRLVAKSLRDDGERHPDVRSHDLMEIDAGMLAGAIVAIL